MVVESRDGEAIVRARCANCGTALDDRYCPSCGQDVRPIPTRLLPLLKLFVLHAIGAEGQVLPSIAQLLVHPGRLTRAYLDGQRARYVSPVYIYLLCTAGFFLLHAYAPFVRLDPQTGAVASRLSALSVESELPASTLLRLTESGMTLESFAPRFDAAVSAYLPILLVALVAGTAVLMAILFWRESVVTHVVFALHWSAFYFVLEATRQAFPILGLSGGVASAVGSLVALLYLAVAMRTVYRRSWAVSAVRAAVSIVIFASFLAGWLWSTTVIAAGLAAWQAT
jgi:hypothetical protein